MKKKSPRLPLIIALLLLISVCGLAGCESLDEFNKFLTDGFAGTETESDSEAEAGAESEPADIAALDEAAGQGDGIRTTDLIDPGQIYMGVITDVTKIVEEAMPSVVSVSNFYISTYSYFGRQFTDESEAIGSGIIVGENDSELLIVTNYHVVHDAETITVQFVDGSIAEALIKGSQPNMDLAIVAVRLDDLGADTMNSIAIAALGDSDTLRVGEPAIAIGNAMGYGQSVTTGVISALNREMSYHTGSDNIESTFIQTDAVINPGNSGGALLNIKGEVIGINSSKISGEAIEGMGYAIPISSAKPIIAELMERETRTKVAHEEQGYMGIAGTTIGSDVSELYGLPQGVYVRTVYSGTPAERAGIEMGDIITHFDGIAVNNWQDLLRRLTYYSAGDVVEVTLLTGDAVGGYDERSVTMTLAKRPQE